METPYYNRKHREWTELYKGILISVRFRVYSLYRIENNKWKLFRTRNGTNTRERDAYGKLLFKSYTSQGEALQKAKDYIDNFVVCNDYK